ncbi:MAG: Fic family protein [Chloroflexota bacterium]
MIVLLVMVAIVLLAVLRGITADHPFQDGNKRTGFLLATLYLEQVGHPLPKHLSVESAEALWQEEEGRPEH